MAKQSNSLNCSKKRTTFAATFRSSTSNYGLSQPSVSFLWITVPLLPFFLHFSQNLLFLGKFVFRLHPHFLPTKIKTYDYSVNWLRLVCCFYYYLISYILYTFTCLPTSFFLFCFSSFCVALLLFKWSIDVPELVCLCLNALYCLLLVFAWLPVQCYLRHLIGLSTLK